MASPSAFRAQYLAAKRENERRSKAKAKPKARKAPEPGLKDYATSGLSALYAAANPQQTGMALGLQLGQALPSIYGNVSDYLTNNSPADVLGDVWGGAKATVRSMAANPLSTIADFVPGVGEVKGLGEDIQRAAELRAAGNPAAALTVERMALPFAVASLLPGVGEARGAGKMAVRAAEDALPDLAVRALPAPQKTLALPAPKPARPEYAVKTRGGQWWPDIDISDQFSAPRNYSPEFAVRRAINNQFVGQLEPQEQALRDWFEKAATRYIRTDLGSPEDPLRALAEQGNLHIADLTPDQWSQRARMNIYAEPIGYYTVPPSAPVETEAGIINLNFGPEQGEVDQLLGAAPWLRKAPVTDELYGLSQDVNNQLGFHHLLDEMGNALDPRSGLPPELALDPGSLQRMGMAQASERVGRINRWRAEQAANAALQARDNPATQLFKEYPENNPLGLRWVELRAPEGSAATTGLSETDTLYNQLSPSNAIRPSDEGVAALQDALRYEGDTMGHCVGGYCNDVLSGRSRIFSLRDAKGEPHVTIETGRYRVPLNNWDGLRHQLDDEAQDAAYDAAMDALRARGDDALFDYEGNFTPFGNAEFNREQDIFAAKWLQANGPDDIVQIKGKQNRAPNDQYLPFVQDFVKSGQWGNVGDLGNTGLVRLPDGRYITAQQAEEGIAAIPDRVGSAVYDPSYLHAMDPDIWSQVAPHFEGFAIGGRVERDRCFCQHPFSAKG